MNRNLLALVVGMIALSGIAVAGEPNPEAQKYWPAWRGPLATGVAPLADPPIEWSETKNIRWKVEIPGTGAATPIVWGDRVYVLTAVKTDKKPKGAAAPKKQDDRQGRRRSWMGTDTPTNVFEFVVIAIDRRTGKTVWQRTACEALPHEGGHREGSQASPSPITDGEHIFAHFGSRGLYCYDLDGNLKWSKDFGKMKTRMGFGEGSSPALYGDTIVINWDHEGDSFVVALDKRTGKELWKTPRDEITSWATPIIVDVDGKPQVIINATKLVRSYDLATGDLVWQCGGMTMNVIPSPVYRDGMVYLLSGFRGNALQAIRLSGAKGDITNSKAIAWKHDKDTPYVPSPLLFGDSLYFLKTNNAILSCFHTSTGQPHYAKKRLEGLKTVYASPVGAADRVYIAGRSGTTVVVQRGSEFKVLATNKLDDGFTASPAIAGNELFLRGHKHLYCLARE